MLCVVECTEKDPTIFPMVGYLHRLHRRGAHSSYRLRKGNKGCPSCGYVDPEDHLMLRAFLCAIPSSDLKARYPTRVPVDAWFADHMTKTRSRCPVCALSGRRTYMDLVARILEVPEVVLLSIDGGQFSFTPELVFDCSGEMAVLNLRGIIYGGSNHFTCRFIDSIGRIWYHDGITTRRGCLDDGFLSQIEAEALENTRGKRAVALIYARCPSTALSAKPSRL